MKLLKHSDSTQAKLVKMNMKCKIIRVFLTEHVMRCDIVRRKMTCHNVQASKFVIDFDVHMDIQHKYLWQLTGRMY